VNVALVQSTPYPPEEGIGNYVRNLSRELLDRGHSVTVVTRGGLGRSETQDGGLRVVRLPCPPLYPFHVDLHGLFVNRFLERSADRFDLVHTHTPLTPVVRTDLPVVATVHTSVVEDIKHVTGWSPRDAMSRVTYTLASRRLVAGQTDAADRITTVSDRVRGELGEHYGVEDATVVRNGVDADQFRPAGDDELRSDGDGDRDGDRNGDPGGDDPGYVLYVGRLDYPKGLPDLVDAAQRVLERHGVEFVITGKGPQRESLERRVEEAGIEDRVRFTGYVPRERQIRLYQNATAFVLPSHYEGLPTVLLEAMACGTPAVATTVGGCPEVIEDGVDGLLVQPGDPPALSDAIATLVADPELRARMGTTARQTILERYTWDTIADLFEREYRLAAGAGDSLE
jgi:glycosyltransferase involved in cell wall biosynthesis